MIFDSVKEIRRLRKELCEANKKISCQLQRIIDLEDDNKALENLACSQEREIAKLQEKLSHSIGVDNTKEYGCFPFD